jgi:cyclopropane fatty-acyl-phospholipid synthase-like methyltransferase
MTPHPQYPHPGSVAPRGPEDLYVSPPPWDIGRPQAVFRALADAGAITGRVVDVGCGTGEHTLMCAAMGLDATGVDLAADALETARGKAGDRGLSARFLQWDARNLAELAETFDTVLDCGLFHIFGADDRAAYVTSLSAAVRPGGRYFMLGISDQEPGSWWPHRLTHAEIAAALADGWRIDAIEPAAIEITTEPAGVRAWSVAATRS